MARPSKSNVVVSVEVDRATFDKLNQVYAVMGLNLLDELTKELQRMCDSSLSSKIKIFEGFATKDGNTK